VEPLLTIVVPAYNASPYLRRSLDSVTTAGPEVEIVVVDDGSTDDTAAIAAEYAESTGGRVRVVSQANAGHGGAVNRGVKEARGRFVRVVDADDWLNAAGFRDLVTALAGPAYEADVVVTNFLYDKEGKRLKASVRYDGALPRRRLSGWADTRRFGLRDYLLMHSLTYRTDVIRASGMKLPEHCFYVDNLFAFVPLGSVKTLYYLDLDLYHYAIGREDQSVHESVMVKRLDQQLRVNREMVEWIVQADLSEPRLDEYLHHYLAILMAVSSMMCLVAGTPEALAKKAALWRDTRAASATTYRKVRWTPYGVLSNVPGPFGRQVSLAAYRLARKVVGFN
jgi:glycosyltransferase involved in cell wall biosynthesis